MKQNIVRIEENLNAIRENQKRSKIKLDKVDRDIKSTNITLATLLTVLENLNSI